MNETRVHWDFDSVGRFMREAFVTLGVPEEHAAISAEVLLTADRRGIDSHGVGRFKPIYVDRILAGIQNPVTEFEIVREGPTTAVIDGHDGMGHYISHRANRMAMDKARQYGLGMVVVVPADASAAALAALAPHQPRVVGSLVPRAGGPSVRFVGD